MIRTDGRQEASTGSIDLSDHDIIDIEMMLQYLYSLDYDVVFHQKGALVPTLDNAMSEDPPISDDTYYISLSSHAHLYAMGDRYGIFGLKAIAQKKFEVTLGKWHCDWRDKGIDSESAGDLAAAVETIYSLTVDSDEGLRLPIVYFLRRRLSSLLEQTWFKDLLLKVPELSIQLLTQAVNLKALPALHGESSYARKKLKIRFST